MPWCEGCQKFYSPNTLRADGTCPEHHPVSDPQAPPEKKRAPWHFWLLLLVLAVYLGWRFVQLISWLIG
jgi:hypothetical protein